MNYPVERKQWGRGAAVLAACLLLCLVSCGQGGKDTAAASGAENKNGEPVSSAAVGGVTYADPFGRLAGTYYIDGDTSAAHVTVTADGTFTAYYASGTVEEKGTVRYESGSPEAGTLPLFVFYTAEGNPYMGFVDSGEAEIAGFETGNGDWRYVRVKD